MISEFAFLLMPLEYSFVTGIYRLIGQKIQIAQLDKAEKLVLYLSFDYDLIEAIDLWSLIGGISSNIGVDLSCYALWANQKVLSYDFYFHDD